MKHGKEYKCLPLFGLPFTSLYIGGILPLSIISTLQGMGVIDLNETLKAILW